MEDIWLRIEDWLRANAPDVLDKLNPGASEADINALEDHLSIHLPDEVNASYRIHNGQSAYQYGLIDGRELLSLDRTQMEWRIWKDLLDGGAFQLQNGQDQGSEPAPGIRNVWWSAQWIPLTYDGGGNHDCLDLNPTEGGTVGQIITLWHDSAERDVVAPSFRDWLLHYAEGLESGQFIFSEPYSGIVRSPSL